VVTFWPKQVAYASALLLAVVVTGGLLLWAITEGDLTLWEATYFSIITVSTVGFEQPAELKAYPGATVVVAVLILCGLGTVAFFNSTLTAFLVEGRLGKALRRGRMYKRLTHLQGHIIVAGCGRTGRFCVEELVALGKPFVVIDLDDDLLQRMNEERCEGNLLYVVGDATEDHDLIAAGVERASGLVAALSEDRDNVFVALSARTLNPTIQIVAKSLSPENEPKLLKAGANKLVSPHRIGGFRLVSELVRPRSMEFLDEIQAMSTTDLHMEDVELSASSTLVGKTLAKSAIREESNALIVAIREPDGRFIHNPGADHRLSAGSHLIVVGDLGGVRTVRHLAAPE
jgi:voltage-gated potassium channel